MHVLARFGRTLSQAEWVKEIKRTSSLWIKERDPRVQNFAWQAGYGCFRLARPIWNLCAITSRGRMSITASELFRMSFARCCKSTARRGTNDMCGNDYARGTRTPLGVAVVDTCSQGRPSYRRPTLGFETESRWDRTADPRASHGRKMRAKKRLQNLTGTRYWLLAR